MYRGRFAPSPTGPLHAGSLVAALASWLDARAHGGQWLVRLEDVDTTRTVAGAGQQIMGQLHACGLVPDEPPTVQSHRVSLYAQALDQLVQQHQAYPCTCTRRQIAAVIAQQGGVRPRHAELVYPGTCRPTAFAPAMGAHHSGESHPGNPLQGAMAWRFYCSYMQNRAVPPVKQGVDAPISIANCTTHWTDRRLGPQQQDVARDVGDFVLRRADGCYTYQLAVVVDDAAQGVTHVVRGCDLADNTARQLVLQQALGLPSPQYLHTPLVLAPNGEKLSKQHGAQAVDTATVQTTLAALHQAAGAMGLPESGVTTVPEALHAWTAMWANSPWCASLRLAQTAPLLARLSLLNAPHTEGRSRMR